VSDRTVADQLGSDLMVNTPMCALALKIVLTPKGS
jgi:hypothetical protein